jgi:3-oxoacyl-[acyl-carrier-protein] synthase-1
MSGLYVHAVGMACPLGLRWRAACAAMRAGITRRQMLPYWSDDGDELAGSCLASLGFERTAQERWAYFLAHAVKEAGGEDVAKLPMVLSVPGGRAGRPTTPSMAAKALSPLLGATIDPGWIRVISEGAPGGYAALAAAHELLRRGPYPSCLVGAADSLIHADALGALARQRRLLSESNSDGVSPGEGAACLRVSLQRHGALAVIRGIGFGREPALLTNDVPMRAHGTVTAARAALEQAGLALHDIDFRLSDAAGDSFAFREQSLLVSRLLRKRKEELPLWLAADSLGDTGAAAGLCGIAWAIAAFERRYAPGRRALGCVGSVEGTRAALVLEDTRGDARG